MIKWIVISIVGLILLGYMGVDVKKAVESTAAKNNLEYAKEVVIVVWQKYLKGPVVFAGGLFTEYIYKPIIKIIIEKIGKKISVQDQGRFFSDFSRGFLYRVSG